MRCKNCKQIIFIFILALTIYNKYPWKYIFLNSILRSFNSASASQLPMDMSIPFFWPPFGKTDNEAGTAFDRKAERSSHWTTTNWLEKHKYIVEVHNCTTADGYLLNLQRIPKPGKQPVLLVHGLLTSSLAWVLLGPGRSLAFLLADRNYDVWLANLRGSAYARSHTQYTTNSVDYWNFSFHEMGAYDLPAIMDRIGNETSYQQMVLIGHSQALNTFLVLCSIHPEYNERILLMQALAPIVQLHDFVNFKSDDVRRVMRFVKAKAKTDSYELFPAGYLRKKCLHSTSDHRQACLKLMRTFAGIGRHSKSTEPQLYGQLLQGGSLKEIKHLEQIWSSGDFTAYDYGVAGNRKHYNNTVEPYNYNLSLVTAPLLLYFGESDAIATPIGVHSIYSRLLGSVVGVYRIAAVKFNHFDFLCANDVKTLVNDRVIDMMEQHLAGKLAYVIE